ncbi:unnamed protein product [Blepharisma stoltei]|uniref:Calpain catalytic domain-containing protein n=1 Tax=Blepharisma stoltei TaxID=1481888 RepID=A0AAU9IX35_9CILI|nr:unnamed protein product [Blepharisma stoltei]
MSTYVSDFYARTVFLTPNIEEVRTKIEELVSQYVGEDKKFNDPDFGPTEKDPTGELAIFYPPDEANEMQGDASVGQYNNIAGLHIDMIKWLRPLDFCKDPSLCAFITREESDDESDEENKNEEDPEEEQEEKKPAAIKRSTTKKATVGKSNASMHKNRSGASSLDVMQGNLGDCWFISGMALVAGRDDLFDQLICRGYFEEFEKFGLYVFRMYKNCRVHYVIVDDKIPCLERANGRCFPAFARCRNRNEFWVSLIEKAYAKLNIKYINLTSGFIDEALQDLTGLAPEMIRFTSSVDNSRLWQMLKILVYSGSLIGASLNFLGRRDIPDEDKRELQVDARRHGIQYGHAYGILDIREVPFEEDPNGVLQFLRLKNPWGKENNMEWNGDWSDADTRWTPELKDKYNEVLKDLPDKFDKDELFHVWGAEDNIFIMHAENFAQYFNTIMAVRDFPDEWSGVRYYTGWNPSYGIPPRGKNWTKNPQFPFYIKKTTDISILLQQPDPRSVAENRPPFKKLTLLIVVFKLDMAEKSVGAFVPDRIALQSQGADSRCVMAGGELKAGKYSIVIMNSSEGVCSDCYLSIYFSCQKDEIAFENKSWEVILEEEEGERARPTKLDIGKSLADSAINASKKEQNQLIKQAMLPHNLQNMVNEKPSLKPIGMEIINRAIKGEKKEEEEKALPFNLQSMINDKPLVKQIGKEIVRKGLNEEKKKEEVKSIAFGKAVTKPATPGLVTDNSQTKLGQSYSQGIKELRKNIQQNEIEDDLEFKIQDPLAQEIEFERDMAILFGLEYNDYKTFHSLPTEQQEAIIQDFQDVTNQNSTILDLNYYYLGNRGLNAILDGIEDFPNLEYLYLRENKLGDLAVCELCRRLELSRQLGIVEIDLSYNTDLTDNAGLALVALATRIRNIQKIVIENTDISSKVQQKIIEVTERNRKVKGN